LVSVVVVVALLPEGVVTVVDLLVSVVGAGEVVVVPDGVVDVVEPGGVVTTVVLLLAGGAVGASAGFTSTLVVDEGAGVTSVLVQPTTPKARRAARIYGDFIVRIPSAGWLFECG
jgi:hypothetical protein